MSVRLDGIAIRLEGRCRIAEAETLLALLLEDGARRVDLSACATLHSALVQVLLALRPAIDGRPDDPFLCAHVLPLLGEDGSASDPVDR